MRPGRRAFSPSSTCTCPSMRWPVLIRRGSKYPAPSVTNTNCWPPVSSSASAGTTGPRGTDVSSAACANMPGLSLPWRFGSSIRTFAVRVPSSIVGAIQLTRAGERVPGPRLERHVGTLPDAAPSPRRTRRRPPPPTPPRRRRSCRGCRPASRASRSTARFSMTIPATGERKVMSGATSRCSVRAAR